MSFQHTMTMAIKQATRQRDLVAEQVSRMEARRQAAQDQWGQLKSYADETQSNYLHHAQRSLHPSLMRHHHQFMGRLDEAIHLQEEALGQVIKQLAQHRLKLMACEQRLVLLDKWYEKKLSIERLAIEKMDQKLDDEMAQQMYARAKKVGLRDMHR